MISTIPPISTSIFSAGATNADVFANLPTTANAGDLYYCTDSSYVCRYNGTAWQYFLNGTLVTPPPTTGWSSDNMGSCTTDTLGGFQTIIAPQIASAQLHLLYRTAPATPYAITSACKVSAPAGGGHFVGFRDGTGKIIYFIQYVNANNNAYITETTWNSSTSVLADQNIFSPGFSLGAYLSGDTIWAKIRDDGTTLYYYLSRDYGLHWQLFVSYSRTAFFGSGPTQVCFGVYNNVAPTTPALSVVASLVNWAITTS